MKFLVKVLSIVVCGPVFAQSYFNCGFNQAYEKLFQQDPSARARFEAITKMNADAGKLAKNINATATYTIPVVFHILHKGGSENISDAQVYDAVAILNRDFQKLNSDTSQIVTQFKNLAADCSIQFSLATLDENGYCTNGITRHYDSRTNWPISAGDYVYTWDPSKYLNIYVVKTLPSGTAGYTYLPGTVGANMDAIVILHNYVGSIGTASSFSSRSLTHEVGHWFNLSHVWGNTNNPGVACGDDGVSDTPLTKGHTSCNLSGSGNCTSGVTENVQNYMEYSFCSRMFTQGQKTRMHNALNGSAGNRINLWDFNNLVATGVINPISGCAPKAEFVANSSVTCVGNSLSFIDYSYNAPVNSWFWSSTLASNTSTLQNGILTFTGSGLASVKLIASNVSGSDSVVKLPVMVMAGANSGIANVMESFENGPFPDSKWLATTPQYGSPFIQTSNAAATGSNCIWVNNYFDNPNGPVVVYSPAFNLQNAVTALLDFKYAYAQKSTSNNDQLKVFVSTNCGASWSQLFSKAGAQLNTTGTVVTQQFLNPTPSQWSSQSCNVVSFSGNPVVHFKFEFTPAGGNNVFIDDINLSLVLGVYENTNELPEVAVYPNPFNDVIQVENKGLHKITSVKLFDVSLREIGKVNTEDLTESLITLSEYGNVAKGVYFLQVNSASGSKTVKLIKH